MAVILRYFSEFDSFRGALRKSSSAIAETARRLKSVEILSGAAQLHEKSHLTRRIALLCGTKNIAGRFLDVINIVADREKFMTLTGELS